MDTINLADLYDLEPLEWTAVEHGLDDLTQAPGTGGPDRHTCWLATVNPNGTPHVTGVGGFWWNGEFWFQTGPATRKATNLARDPRCTISVATHAFDLTVEGFAEKVTDPSLVASFAEHCAAGGWPAEVDASGSALTAPYSAPSAGPPPWHVYRITSASAFAVGTVDPGGATRWRFP